MKPENKMDFEFKLKKNLDFPIMLPNYELSVTNFGPFYEALVIYKKAFLRVFKFLSVNNRINVPPCNMKDGGILLCFVNKIPFEYGRIVLKTLAVTNFDSAEEMIVRFYEAVEGDRKVSRQARPLQLKLFSSKSEVSKGRSFHGPDKAGSSNVVRLNVMSEDNHDVDSETDKITENMAINNSESEDEQAALSETKTIRSER